MRSHSATFCGRIDVCSSLQLGKNEKGNGTRIKKGKAKY